MKITVHKDVFSKIHPQLKIALILATNLDNASRSKETIHLLKDAERMVQLVFNKDTVKTHHLISPWAAVQQEFGKKASHHQTSVERILQQVISKKPLAANDVMTNIAYYLSLKYIIPIAVDDATKLKGDLTFVADKDLCYHDAAGPLGKKFDYWKSPRTVLTPKSTSALLHLEGLPPVTSRKMKEIMAEAQAMIQTFCGGKTTVGMIYRRKNSVIL